MDEADAYKQRIRDQYDEIAARWHRWTPVMRVQYAPATQLMLDLAHLRPGDRVLDIAAGDGYQSIEAARRVGPTGHVLAVDLAPEQLRYAAAAARDAGVKHFETQVMDAEHLELASNSVDAVLCQFGLMFLPDVERGLREMLRVLKASSRVSLVIFAVDGTPESDVVESIVRRRAGRVEATSFRPSGAALGAPGALREKLEAVGFQSVESYDLQVPFRLPSAAEAVAYHREAHPSLRTRISSLSAEQRDALWREVETALGSFVDADGFVSLNRVVVAAGTRPAALSVE